MAHIKHMIAALLLLPSSALTATVNLPVDLTQIALDTGDEGLMFIPGVGFRPVEGMFAAVHGQVVNACPIKCTRSYEEIMATETTVTYIPTCEGEDGPGKWAGKWIPPVDYIPPWTAPPAYAVTPPTVVTYVPPGTPWTPWYPPVTPICWDCGTTTPVCLDCGPTVVCTDCDPPEVVPLPASGIMMLLAIGSILTFHWRRT